jgi:NADH:ubiquinone reductase (H+-translocating)
MSATDLPRGRHRVVIVGGGFGGLFAAKFLRRAPVEVTLVDRTNHHLFQPLLYQCATGILSEGSIAPPLRRVLRKHRNVRVELANVTDIDLDRKRVAGARPIGGSIELEYDSLIVAAGAGGSYFGHDEYAMVAPGLKTIDDALELRARIFGAFEMAELEDDPLRQAAWLTFAVVGGGPTGVEVAGQITELAHRSLKGNFRRIDPTDARVLLFDAGDAILAGFGTKLSTAAERSIERAGVEVRTGSRVIGITYRDITVEGPHGPETIPCHVKVWAAGVTASPLAAALARASGAGTDRAGRIEVLPDCSLPGYPDVFAVGDMMSLNRLPGVAEVAMQSGIHAARIIKRRATHGDGSKPFKYRDLGSMASISRFSAVVDFKGIRVSGLLGWLMWVFVHLTFLTGFKNRFVALSKWLTAFIGRSRDERTISMLQGSARVIAASAGIKPGEEELTGLVDEHTSAVEEQATVAALSSPDPDEAGHASET